jgi:hypothetical protein
MPATNVMLRTGKEAPDILVNTTMLALRTLCAEQPIAFYELVMCCRDREHVIFGDAADKMLGLLEGTDAAGHGLVHDAVRDIVLAAVDGEDFNMTLQSPLSGA